jgi:hypothetical protein
MPIKAMLSVMLVSALVFTPIAATAQEQSKGFVLEDGTPIKLVLSENLSSASAHTGDLVAFETVEDVKVQGVVVIPRGSNAWATITDSQHKRRLGRAGHLDLNIDKVRLADGEKVLLRAIAGGSGGGHQGAMIGAMVATSIITFGGAALFLLMHGKDMKIPEGTQVTAFIQGDVTLDPAKFTPDALAPKSVPPAPAPVPAAAQPAAPTAEPAATPGQPQMKVVPQPQEESLGAAARRFREQQAAQQIAQKPTQP